MISLSFWKKKKRLKFNKKCTSLIWSRYRLWATLGIQKREYSDSWRCNWLIFLLWMNIEKTIEYFSILIAPVIYCSFSYLKEDLAMQSISISCSSNLKPKCFWRLPVGIAKMSCSTNARMTNSLFLVADTHP